MPTNSDTNASRVCALSPPESAPSRGARTPGPRTCTRCTSRSRTVWARLDKASLAGVEFPADMSHSARVTLRRSFPDHEIQPPCHRQSAGHPVSGPYLPTRKITPKRARNSLRERPHRTRCPGRKQNAARTQPRPPERPAPNAPQHTLRHEPELPQARTARKRPRAPAERAAPQIASPGRKHELHHPAPLEAALPETLQPGPHLELDDFEGPAATERPLADHAHARRNQRAPTASRPAGSATCLGIAQPACVTVGDTWPSQRQFANAIGPTATPGGSWTVNSRVPWNACGRTRARPLSAANADSR